jgi:seryl-tRNA synthetase
LHGQRGRTVIDIRLLREQPELVRQALSTRGMPEEQLAELDRIVELDARTRATAGKRDDARKALKDISARVARSKKAGEKAEDLVQRARELGEEVAFLEEQARELESELTSALLLLPNLPAPDCPVGSSEKDNVVLERHPEELPEYGEHQRIPHWEIGKELGILDLERGAKISGSMFPLYRGAGARLVRALSAFALDRHQGVYEEVRPPTLVKTDTMISTGHLPKFADEAYHLERDDLWAIPTAEVPLTSLFKDEIIPEEDLPARFTATTSCYRREAGAAGRDTRGLLRVHEFDKVELFAYVTEEQAASELNSMVARASSLIEELGLSYRVLDLCTGDIGAAARRTFDLEVYAPGCDQWLEVSSVSWDGDYQARRASIRYRPRDGGKPRLVHTLNGSALAWPRIWAAVVETNRMPDGSVAIPEVLWPYMGGLRVIEGRSKR